jgi:PPK2 family polyphosphate:nucleotide phosphotransferase
MAITSAKIARRYRIDDPKRFRLAEVDPADTAGLDIDKADAKTMLADDIARLAAMQDKLYAQDSWAVLAIFQAMDAAGKDSAIKHVMSGVNPQGCEVHSFKHPSDEELDHDFFWHYAMRLPRRGRIGIFNRSYYEEVLVVRVHPELLKLQKIPPELVTDHVWKQRFKDIHAFERTLAHNGIVVLKFHLHISREEQKRRFLERLDNPAKRWKFSMSDVAERKEWDRYMEAYEDMIRHTSTPQAPWYVVPADNKWFSRMVVAAALVDTLDRLDLGYPKVTGKALAEMKRARLALLRERP